MHSSREQRNQRLEGGAAKLLIFRIWLDASGKTGAWCHHGGGFDKQCPPPSFRAQRSNPESFRWGILDCFAALAMTTGQRPGRRPSRPA